MKVRFIKEGSRYKLQIKNFLGIWRTQMEKMCANAGCVYMPYTNEDKEVLLKYVIMGDYFTRRDCKIVEYPTIFKYDLYEKP